MEPCFRGSASPMEAFCGSTTKLHPQSRHGAPRLAGLRSEPKLLLEPCQTYFSALVSLSQGKEIEIQMRESGLIQEVVFASVSGVGDSWRRRPATPSRVVSLQSPDEGRGGGLVGHVAAPQQMRKDRATATRLALRI
jgi:hypothetical protein